MIRMAPFDSALEPEDIVGKIVFKSLIGRWPGISAPRFVTEVSGNRAYISRLVGGHPSGMGLVARDAVGVADGYIGVTSVGCVCDTVEEANIVILKLRELEALDGISSGISKPGVESEDLSMMARTSSPMGDVEMQLQ